MKTLIFFKVQSDLGQDLLENYVKPICNRLGVQLKEAPANANRGYAVASQTISTLVLWDCSVEEGHVYNAFNNWVKTTKKHVIVSRTPLPRNVLTHFQCAPIHGEQFSNEILGEWLDKQLYSILYGQYSSETYQNKILARHYWMFEAPAEFFLSFRGTHKDKAREWKQNFETDQKTFVRMVPENEYSYPTECVTLQQMWEGAARLMHEIRATERVIIFKSTDYFDSFWTSTEFLVTLWMLGKDPKTGKPMLNEAFFVEDWSHTSLQSFRDGFIELAVPRMGQANMDRFAKLINNSDPITSAPETQIPPRGLAKLIALFVRRLGYYEPEFMTPNFWHTVRVPCPVCKPKNRKPQDIDWTQHMFLPDSSPRLDYFGYFPAEPQQLETGTMTCPACDTKLRLKNKRGARTLWVPIQTTEKKQNRSVIQEHKVWEVIN